MKKEKEGTVKALMVQYLPCFKKPLETIAKVDKMLSGVLMNGIDL